VIGRRRPPAVRGTWAELNGDPFPVWRRARDRAAVVRMPKVGPPWFVTRWDDVKAVLVDDDTYSSRLRPLRPSLEGSLPFLDGEEHDSRRAAVQPHFNPRNVRGFAETTIPEIAARLLDEVAAEGQGDLVTLYTDPLATEAVRILLSLEDLSLDDMRRRRAQVAVEYAFATAPASSGRMIQPEPTLLARARSLRGHPDGSILSALVNGADGQSGLGEEEALTTFDTLLFVAMDGFRDSISQTLLALLSNPDQLDLVRDAPALAKEAVEEAARWQCPVHTVFRQPVVDVEIGGQKVPAGTLLAVSVGSANRDERRWSAPDRFDIRRDEGMHLAFATGRHHCLGAWLARQAGAVAVRLAVERLSGLRVDPGRPPSLVGWTFHRVHELPAIWG
jgi:cytochrome P450